MARHRSNRETGFFMKRALLGLFGLALGASACGGAAVPQEQLTAAQAAIRAAEVGGAPNDPQAALLVKKCQDGVAEAKKLIEDGNNHRAEMVLMRAQVDAELALALAQEISMKNEAAGARKQVQELKSRQQ
jgi:hypothetical protein